jgi:hypothetical protein
LPRPYLPSRRLARRMEATTASTINTPAVACRRRQRSRRTTPPQDCVSTTWRVAGVLQGTMTQKPRRPLRRHRNMQPLLTHSNSSSAVAPWLPCPRQPNWPSRPPPPAPRRSAKPASARRSARRANWLPAPASSRSERKWRRRCLREWALPHRCLHRPHAVLLHPYSSNRSAQPSLRLLRCSSLRLRLISWLV